ncbi:MAG: type II toxin-antitoxin system RelE/ParE family toxin [Deltaproteobacteria bacterium]|nr:type II toxin-antitoxin system RelE/ParE family toxin [Deltaproteobacteria bacterium]
MARKVVWAHEAIEDIDATAGYIARDSPYYASAFVQEVLDVGRSLDVVSSRGRVVPEIGNQNIRELFVREYRMIYCIEKGRVVILGLIHGRRDLENLLKKGKRR